MKGNAFDLDIYSLEDGCPLTEAQLNVYLDIIIHNKKDSYILPSAFEISKKYSADDIINALEVMFEVHPILGMCVSEEREVPYMVKGSKPSIAVESNASQEFINEFIFKRFDLYDSLSRFLIVENDDSYSLYGIFHHLIFDETSKNVFKFDLMAILDGESVEREESFLNVSAFNKQIQETPEFVDAKEFYDMMLSDIEQAGTLLESVGEESSTSYSIDFDIDFDDFLSKNNINKNVLFTSVFAYTLSRFVGSDKVLFNLLENGRDRFNNFDSIGMFVNTFPILVDCGDKETSSFMNSMSDLIYKVVRYNYYPFRMLAEEYVLDANILFQFLPNWITHDEDDEIPVIDADIDFEDLISDFAFYIQENDDDYTLNVLYSKKYSDEFVKRFAQSYISILREINSGSELGEISYISDSDLNILDEYNQTEHDLKYDDILDAFNDNLAEFPDNKLVSFKKTSYTYKEGAFIADKIAEGLKEHGVDRQDCVAFLVERSDLYMFSVLGIMSLGAVFVPLDDKHPDDRLQYMLSDTHSKAVIISDATYERAKELVGNNTALLNISDIVKEENKTLSSLPVDYGDLACILYTSGTTGVPKGVKIPRKAIINLAEFYVGKYNLSNEDVFGQYSSIGFDAAFKALFAAIYAGACLDVIPNEMKLDMNALNSHFIKQGINHVDITTPVAKLLIKQIKDLPLDVLFTGGDKLGEVTGEINCRFVDGYGPTEAYVEVATIDVKDRIDPSSIGHLIDNIKAYILDNEFRRVPVGAVGELYLAGNQIAYGYLNREEETAKAFLENPFDDGLMYRTGDLVRLLPDGSLGIVGRSDSQVKIRGNRVELSEVESVIRGLDYVEDVTVQTIKNGDNNELVAYVVPAAKMDNLNESICDDVQELKPDYMVPSFVIELDNIPFNVNGKIDTHALPKVDLESLRGEYVAPTTETEKDIVEAFEKIFNQEKISVHDDFVSLGGNSLTAIKLKSLLNLDINVMTLFKARTPYKIAQIIEGNKLEYGFELVKKGSKNQNMFILPPGGGVSFILLNLVKNIDFEGNVYLIDDFKYDLTLDEIRNIEHNDVLTLNHYYDAIKDIFNDGDIIAGYSLGCIYAALICEKLEKTKTVDKCIFIDMPPKFVNNQDISRKEVMNYLTVYDREEYEGMDDEYSSDFKDKLIEVFHVNYKFDFHTPEIKSHAIYLSTSGKFNEDLDNVPDNEYITIDSTHEDIVGKDVYKITKYFN
jgi:amino acid adenylation domain-containing protein